MAAQTFSIKFQGYWRDRNKSGVPAQSGIYCVYEAKYNQSTDKVSLLTLIYIGEADNANTRIADHEKRNDWLKHVRAGNELCYSFGAFSSTNRIRAEAAMIFQHKPPENDEYKDSFPFDRTTMSLSGETALLTTDFTVDRTE